MLIVKKLKDLQKEFIYPGHRQRVTLKENIGIYT